MTDDRKKLSALEDRLVALADDCAFKVSKRPTVYYVELEHPERGEVIYLDRQKTRLNNIAVFVSPGSDLGLLTSIPGLAIPTEFRHGSGMARFPKRMHKGKTPIAYGYLILCADISAYCRLLERLTSEDHPVT